MVLTQALIWDANFGAFSRWISTRDYAGGVYILEIARRLRVTGYQRIRLRKQKNLKMLSVWHDWRWSATMPIMAADPALPCLNSVIFLLNVMLLERRWACDYQYKISENH